MQCRPMYLQPIGQFGRAFRFRRQRLRHAEFGGSIEDAGAPAAKAINPLRLAFNSTNTPFSMLFSPTTAATRVASSGVRWQTISLLDPMD
jgi:hypothetical protein